MPEIGPEHPITYRQEILAPIFRKLTSRESCTVIGVASMGKSRLLQFLLREDVRTHYLGDAAPTTLFLWVDSNRMAEFTAWGLHELLLTALVEGSGHQPAASSLRVTLTEWREKAITLQNGLLAQRYVELALQMLCEEQGLHLCFVLDEFDEPYRSLPAQALASLRALRDRHKYALTYLLFQRDDPGVLRNPNECEGFYELLARSVLGLKPYNADDTQRVIEQVATRRTPELPRLTDEAHKELLRLSGGHPGLLVALLDALTQELPLGESWDDWARRQPKAEEECRKIWQGLRRDERTTLHQIAQKLSTSAKERGSLLLKGLIQEQAPKTIRIFSPLLHAYAAIHPVAISAALQFQHQSGDIWVEGVKTEALSGKEFDLFSFLYEHLGQVREVDQIIHYLYPDDDGYKITDNNIASLIGRVRKKIEPDPNHPQYLLNVRGRGYKLVDEPETNQ
jgi:DNA-binding winged helix-turn-helix (wHTH) protein